MTDTIDTPPLVVRRVFPAAVKLNGQDVPGPCLVILTSTTVYVYREPGPAMLSAVLAAPGSYTLRGTFEPPSVPLGRADTTAGTVEWTTGQGCGCSHPLKTFHPFPARRLA